MQAYYAFFVCSVAFEVLTESLSPWLAGTSTNLLLSRSIMTVPA